MKDVFLTLFVSLLSALALHIFVYKNNFAPSGIDVIASMVKEKVHGIDVEKIIGGICYVIIGISYFVYGDLTCILLSIVQMFVFEKAAAFVLKDSRNTAKFEIITKKPE